jgi:hypothetical protein
MAKNYAPFRGGEVEVGRDKKCSCGAARKNQHSLRESAKCDWLKRPMGERRKLIEAGLSNRDMAGNLVQLQRQEAAA